MDTTTLITVAAIALLLSVAVAPADAAPAPGQVDECVNADEGLDDRGPPGFVGGLLPDFLGDLFAALPVPNFVKALFGAPTC